MNTSPRERSFLRSSLSSRRSRGAQRGAVLVTTMLMMLVVGVLAVTMFRGFAKQEVSAGNTLDKQRADEAAQSALQYGEWWLREGHASAPQQCSGVVTIADASPLAVCETPLASPTTLPWSTGFEYRPNEAFAVGSSAGLAAATGDANYAALPRLHVAYLGMGGASGGSPVYRITAVARGGRDDTVSVVQSTYALSGKRVEDLGN